MLKAEYSIPSTQSKNPFISSLTQYQLTGLTTCDTDPCPTIDGQNHVLGFHMCAQGISDPSELNDAAFSTIFSCPGNTTSQSDSNFSNCRADSGASCPEGTLAVACDLSVFCGNSISNCFPEDFGVTDNGDFVPCPSLRS